MSRHDQLDAVLRDLDAADAPTTHRADDLGERARADLDAILAAPPVDRPSGPGADDGIVPLDGRRRRRAVTTRGFVAVAAAAGLVTVGIGVPVLTQPAYAGWSATPQGVDAPGTEEAAQECRDHWAPHGTLEEGFADPADLRATVTEARGPFTFTVLRGPEGQFTDCMLKDRWLLGGRGGAGSATPVPPTPAPGADQIDTAVLGAVGPSTRTVLGIRLPHREENRSYAYGRAGQDVLRVTVHSPAQGEVEASVQDGLWAAWWPTPEDAVEVEGLEATLTLRDGSTRDVALDEVHIPWPGRP